MRLERSSTLFIEKQQKPSSALREAPLDVRHSTVFLYFFSNVFLTSVFLREAPWAPLAIREPLKPLFGFLLIHHLPIAGSHQMTHLSTKAQLNTFVLLIMRHCAVFLHIWHLHIWPVRGGGMGLDYRWKPPLMQLAWFLQCNAMQYTILTKYTV